MTEPGPERRQVGHRSRLMFLLPIMLIALACSAHRVEPTHGNANQAYVCHKGKKTLEIAHGALSAHLNHGDTRGTCR